VIRRLLWFSRGAWTISRALVLVAAWSRSRMARGTGRKPPWLFIIDPSYGHSATVTRTLQYKENEQTCYHLTEKDQKIEI
jgi:hypothetical protein